MKIIKIRSEVKSKIKSFGQAFLKACGVSGQSPDNSRSELKAFKRSNGVNFQPKAEKRGKPAREVFPFKRFEINRFESILKSIRLTSIMIICFIMMCTSYIPVNAETIRNMCDFSGRLSDMEAERLENILDKASAESGFCISVVIADNLEGKSDIEYAESFYNENFSKYPQSIILLINYDTNNNIIFTGENSSKYFTESDKTKIISEAVSENTAEGKISDAVTSFSEKITEFSKTIPAQTEPVKNEKDEKYERENNIAFSIVFGIIVGVVCGIIVSVYIKSLYKRTENDFAFSNHKCTHKIDFTVKEDKFRREFVNKSDSSS